VVILIHMQGPALVEHGGLGSFGVAVHPAPSADDALDVLGGAGATDTEQPLFGLRCRHAAQRPHLWRTTAPRARAPALAAAACRARGPRGHARAPRPGRAQCARSATRRTSGTRCPSRRA